ncbi:MAG TPA: hypothetical protein VNW90_01105 [Acetobacteraceae bacterium]|nr:hypothetical protein [Acetobacteraceae bacterium]
MRKLMLASTFVAMGLLGNAAIAQPSPAFISGLNDRNGWEVWFNSLSGDYQAGANFWAGQRSLPHPTGCYAEGGRDLGLWGAGCVASQQRLGLSDIRRKAEPEYRLGWNAWTPGAAEAMQQLAAQAAANRQAQAERDAAEAQRIRDQDRADREALAAKKAREDAENKAAAQLAAENSPDNRCKEPKIAGDLIESFNSLQTVQDIRLKAVDIEHLITLSFKVDQGQNIYNCHGVFVLSNGRHLPGTLYTRLNVAGNIIIHFTVDDE